jgi:hypothetical protein
MFLPPQDKGVLEHSKRQGELQMKFNFIRTVRDSFKKDTANWRTLDSILDNAETRQEVSQKQMDYVAYLYTKKK